MEASTAYRSSKKVSASVAATQSRGLHSRWGSIGQSPLEEIRQQPHRLWRWVTMTIQIRLHRIVDCQGIKQGMYRLKTWVDYDPEDATFPCARYNAPKETARAILILYT
jgi:hypothetical protein